MEFSFLLSILNKSSWPILISKVFSGLPKSPRNHLLTSKKMQNNDKCGNKSEIATDIRHQIVL